MNSTCSTYEAAKNLYLILRRRIIVVRALIWRSRGGYETSQVEIMKLHSLSRHQHVLSRFSFGVNIDLKRNTIDKVEHSLDVSPTMNKMVEIDNDMINHIETILSAWSKKEDLLLGRSEEKAPNPWIAAQTPFFGNVFISPHLRTAVPPSHPDMLPVLTMCASSMAVAFVGMDQHVIESELLAHFNSLVVQARREGIRNLYGSYCS